MHGNVEVLSFTFYKDKVCIGHIDNYLHLPLPMQIDNALYQSLDAQLQDWLESRVSSNYDLHYSIDFWFSISLSDAYWVRPSNMSVYWEEVNLHDNAFNSSNISPDTTAIGALPKYWTINKRGERILYKRGNSKHGQEPYNEVINYMLSKHLYKDASIHLPYETLWDENGQPWSICKCFTSPTVEFISACDILDSVKQSDYPNMSVYEVYVDYLCERQITKETVTRGLDQMFTTDYLTGNIDRHFNNFGVLRDVNTLRIISLSPTFDCGNSLRCNEDIVSANEIDFETDSLTYTESDQVQLIQNPIKIQHSEKLLGDISNYLYDSSHLSEDRILSICDFIRNRIQMYRQRSGLL